MVEANKVIYRELKKLNISVFDTKPQYSTQYPFITYDISESYRSVSPIIYKLTVNVWTKGGNYELLEDISQKVNKLLYDSVFYGEDIAIKSKKMYEERIPDEDYEVKRKEIAYQLRRFNIKD